MKLGVFSILFNNLSIDQVLDYLEKSSIFNIEIGAGGYSRSNHIDLDYILSDDSHVKEYLDKFQRKNITITALGAQGNPVHPDAAKATRYHEDFQKTVLAAQKLGVKTILLLSGCPGGNQADLTPNWITCPWPDDFALALDYQWNEVLIPYWKKAVDFAENHGIEKLAIEPHPGFCVYNPETLLKLRNAVSNSIGINFDPSHLFWQGIDPVLAINEVKDCIFHVHAKDCSVNKANCITNGILDSKPYSDFRNRSWNFRSVGYGQSLETWKNIISALVSVGYSGVISIEHEDALMTAEEGIEKTVEFLNNIIIKNDVKTKWWEMRSEG